MSSENENDIVKVLDTTNAEIEKIPICIHSFDSNTMVNLLWTTDTIESGYYQVSDFDDLIKFLYVILKKIQEENKNRGFAMELIVPSFRPNNETDLYILPTLFLTMPSGPTTEDAHGSSGGMTYQMQALNSLNTAAHALTIQLTEKPLLFMIKDMWGMGDNIELDPETPILEISSHINDRTGIPQDKFKMHVTLEVDERRYELGLDNLSAPVGLLAPFSKTVNGVYFDRNQAVHHRLCLTSRDYLTKQLAIMKPQVDED